MKKTLKIRIEGFLDTYVSDDCSWVIGDKFIVVVQTKKTTDGTYISRKYTYPMRNIHVFCEEERE